MTTRHLDLGSVEQTDAGAILRFERRFESPPADVWQALTEPSELALWLSEATVDLRIGGQIEVRFDDGTMTGVITELVPDAVLGYTWLESGRNESYVRWELARAGTGTVLRLTHTKLAADSASGFAGGWHLHLDRLQAAVRGAPFDWNWKTFEELEALYLNRTARG